MTKRRFEQKEQQHISGGIIKSIVDNQTGVNDLTTGSLGVSGMTPLLDRNGNVMIDPL